MSAKWYALAAFLIFLTGTGFGLFLASAHIITAFGVLVLKRLALSLLMSGLAFLGCLAAVSTRLDGSAVYIAFWTVTSITAAVVITGGAILFGTTFWPVYIGGLFLGFGILASAMRG